MRDARRIKERVEIRIDRTQAVWLALGAVAAMGAMFALGVVVGRRAARIEPKPPAINPIAEVEAQEHEMRRFYETLTDTSQRNTSKHRGNSKSTKSAPSEAAQPSATSSTTRQVPTRAATEQKPAAVDASRGRADTDLSSIRRALEAGPPQRGDYTVQVSAFESRPEAEAYVAALQRKGFKPFVVAAQIPGKGTWYRVRMGRFPTQHDAARAKTLLAQSDIPAWVLRE